MPALFARTLCLAVGLTGVAAGLAGCKPSVAEDPRTRDPLVLVAQAEAASPAHRGFTGVVAARIQSNLTFRVGGKITARLVNAGQAVQAGQDLLRLDRTDYDHAIVAQRGNAAAARARLVQADADAERFKSLVASGAVSQAAYDRAKAAADSARALLAAAEAQLQVAENEGRYATLTADADGIVMETLAEPGQVVAAGQPVLRLAQAGPREAVVSLPETVRPAIGAPAEAVLYGVAGQVPARLRQISDTADPVTRTFEARYVLEGDGATALLGTTVTLSIPTPDAASRVAIPLGALDDRGSGPGVWILDPEGRSVSFRPVALLQLESERAVLGGGLKLGERVVALGVHSLHEGQTVRLSNQQAGL